MNALFRVKVCGVTTPEDAQMAVDAGADAVGLNFYPGSKRYVSRETAQAIRNSIPHQIRWVGVFVNSPVEEIAEVVGALHLDIIQIHGDEPPEFVRDLRMAGGSTASVPVIRAFRTRSDNYPIFAKYVQACQEAATPLAAALFDAAVAGHFGGAGKIIDWTEFRRARSLFPQTPRVLAGGLDPENVARAIAAAEPDAVDVASGVESSPGRKDPVKTRQFIANARGAWENIAN